jgi:hypothetical protein
VKKTKKVSGETKALVISEVSLAPRQQTAISQPTPAMFIKEKPGRGGKKVSYVETGYVVSRLNTAFSPAGWDFEVIADGKTDRQTENNTEGEVWVRGKLTIIDHKKGYRVSKTQYGQHPIHKNVPIGDAYKSAASDSLKKCASLFGIAHDVYWKISESEGAPKVPEKTAVKKTSITAEDMKKIHAIIKSTSSSDLLIQIDQKVQASPIYTKTQKEEIHKLTISRSNELD